MLKLSVAITIRERFKQGESLSQISRDLGIDRKTARKYAYMRVFPPVVKKKTPRKTILEPYKAVVDGWLLADNHLTTREQRTAMHIWKELTENHGYEGSYPTVQKYVKRRRQELAEETKAKESSSGGRNMPDNIVHPEES